MVRVPDLCGRAVRCVAGRRRVRARTLALNLVALVGFVPAPERLSAQTIKFRFVGVDMLGGAVWTSDTEAGVAFGTRIGVADLFDRSAQLSLEMDWWTAEVSGVALDVRDIMGGLSLSRTFATGSIFSPYLGLGIGVHGFDSSAEGGEPPTSGGAETARLLDGVRIGATGFGGLTMRLTRTGAIWLIMEYGYTFLSRLSHHELRAGIRLFFGSDQR